MLPSETLLWQNLKPLSSLLKSEVVRLQTLQGYNNMGTIQDICKEPRSYLVESEGKVYRRNSRHILPVPEAIPPQHNEYNPSDHPRDCTPRRDQSFLSDHISSWVTATDSIIKPETPAPVWLLRLLLVLWCVSFLWGIQKNRRNQDKYFPPALYQSRDCKQHCCW